MANSVDTDQTEQSDLGLHSLQMPLYQKLVYKILGYYLTPKQTYKLLP